MQRRTIDIDEEVFAFLQRHSEPLVDTPNDVLRRLLLAGNASQAGQASTVARDARPSGALMPLIRLGLVAAGDVLRHEQPRRRRLHEAAITADGWIDLLDGHVFSRPSPALKTQTGTPINGWEYVHVRSGRTLNELRNEAEGR